MKVNTKVFGEVDIADDKIIEFAGGIIGFPELTKFALIHDEEKGSGSIHWLQSMQEPAFAMPVMDPLLVVPDYNPEVDDELLKKIDAKIESVYPGYKEMIKDTSIKTYNNIKEKLVDLKDQIKINYKNEIGEDRYNDQVETFNEGKENMIESFEPIIDKAAEEAKEIYNETAKNLDKWYKNWKEENN